MDSLSLNLMEPLIHSLFCILPRSEDRLGWRCIHKRLGREEEWLKHENFYSLRCISPRNLNTSPGFFMPFFVSLDPEKRKRCPVVVFAPRFCGIRGI